MLLRWKLKAAPGVRGPGAERPYVTRAAVPEAEADDGHARGASPCSRRRDRGEFIERAEGFGHQLEAVQHANGR